MAGPEHPTGDDMYLAPDLPEEAAQGERDPRTNQRIETDIAAGAVLDPVDVMDRPTAQALWGHEGRRLLAREDDVAVVATANGWTFTALDARLSSRLVELDITDSCPRITRNICTPADEGATVLDLTGVTFHRDGDRPRNMRLQIGTAGLVNFPTAHKFAAVPAGATDIGWRRFGHTVATEAAEFDARYEVHCDDPLWGLLVLNPALMQRLLEHWPVTLVIAANLLAVIKPGWVAPAELPGFQRFTEQLALSARAASTSRTAPLRLSATPTARLSGWSAWPEQPPAPE
jgi:hypothetical protein